MALKFFKKPAFGLDISDYSIELISLGGSFENPQLFAIGRVIIDSGLVEDGKILNKRNLKKSLQYIIEYPKFGEIKTKKLIFALPESKTFIHTFKFPRDLGKKSRLDYIKSQASQIFPYSLEDLYLDHRTMKTNDSEEVLIAASPKEIIDDYLEVFGDLKLQPLAIGLESESLGKSLLSGSEGTILIADMGARTTNFSVFDGGELRFSLTSNIAGNKFTESLVESFKVSFEEAEKLKKEAGLNPKIKKGRVFLVLQKDIQAIIQEIRDIEKYFQEKRGKGFEKIILAGGSAVLPHLPEYLTENLQKEVLVGDPWSKINTEMLPEKENFREVLKINPLFYATCIGSARRALTKDPKSGGVNFLAGQRR